MTLTVKTSNSTRWSPRHIRLTEGLFMRRVARLLSCLAAVSTAFVLAPRTQCHVSAVNATQGADTVLTFQVPTESDTASTVGVTVSCRTPPRPGARSAAARLDVQLTNQAVGHADHDGRWDRHRGDLRGRVEGHRRRHQAGQFGQFVLSVGPLPKVASMTFKVIQSYSDGTQVAWIEVAAPGSNAEPEHPAPVLKLSPASTSSQSAPEVSVVTAEPKKQSQTGPVVLGVVALVVAVAAAGAAAPALVRFRRRTGERA